MTPSNILMRLYYLNVLHMLLTGTVAVGQLATPPLRQDWLTCLGWRQWTTLAALSGLLTPLITTDYLG